MSALFDDWRAAAACRSLPTAAFFPTEKGPTVVAPEVEAACRRCPVAAECLDEVLAWTDEADWGWRAGMAAAERRKLRARRRRGAK